MKRIIALIICLLLAGASFGQKLVIGSQVPLLKDVKWLSGGFDAKSNCVIVFYQQSNASSVEMYEKLKNYLVNEDTKGVVITRDADVDAVALSDGGKVSVGYDANGGAFSAFGVKYLPYAVAIKDGKITWMGVKAGQ